ncbi:hypothetical protein APS_0268 [Acetobacter pasteurianus subsp. pasteurianus LMG 1262 = NBRC 106471]|nr:hypothetical protein APS_0268 [Acetobacter pasteurianus subsp. pasteurianus LMG 1262 = NBRC 106471]
MVDHVLFPDLMFSIAAQIWFIYAINSYYMGLRFVKQTWESF